METAPARDDTVLYLAQAAGHGCHVGWTPSAMRIVMSGASSPARTCTQIGSRHSISAALYPSAAGSRQARADGVQ